MSLRNLLWLPLLATGLAAPVLAMVPIDDFTQGNVYLSGVSGSDTTVGPGILGGSRLTTFSLFAGGPYNPSVVQAPALVYEGNEGWFFYNSTFGNYSIWNVTYGAEQDLNANLLQCGADRFILGACCQLDVDADGGWSGPFGVDGTPMTINLWSNGNNVAVSRDLYGNAQVSQGYIEFEFLFSQFPGIDFTDVDRIQFGFVQNGQNPAVDYGFSGIFINCEDGFEVGADDQPVAFHLGDAYPNPFNPTTTLEYSLAETGQASLKVFDLNGREVATLVDGLAERGTHRVTFDAGNLPSGVYFYSLQANAQTQTRKMLLVK